MTVSLTVNGTAHDIASPPDTPLLYVLRDELGLNAAKYGCGLGQCGACTVHLDGRAIFSCVTPLAAAAGRRVTTLEGLGGPDSMNPLQQAFLDEQAAQCGYCIAGMIMRAQALLDVTPHPDEATIRAHMQPNLCRCGTHMRILRAIRRAARPAGATRADALPAAPGPRTASATASAAPAHTAPASDHPAAATPCAATEAGLPVCALDMRQLDAGEEL
ncbi:(2Fe-2S)-binding protein [Oceanicella sp. SM1341]|uniref:(2Fe-2S)-binding protein n=1 Tax=Oceanicella sp. SM1341 TaxID=1548889 RepID=UPI000E4811E6